MTIVTNGWEPKQKRSDLSIDKLLKDLENKMKAWLLHKVQVMIDWVIVFEM